MNGDINSTADTMSLEFSCFIQMLENPKYLGPEWVGGLLPLNVPTRTNNPETRLASLSLCLPKQ